MIIYGKNAINEILLTDKNIEKAFIINDKNQTAGKDIIAKLKAKKVPVQYVDKKALDKLVGNENHRGFAIAVSDFKYATLEDIFNVSKQKNKPPFIIILDELNDPNNFGSIIRSCECAGVDGIVIPSRRAVGVTDTVIKVAQGASEHIKIAKVTNLNEAIRQIKQNNIFVYACDMDGKSAFKTNLTGPLALCVGSEGFGISRLTKELCDGVVSLPLYGKINSLNAANACAALIYEAVRQRDEN